jgi:hypothetical protein
MTISSGARPSIGSLRRGMTQNERTRTGSDAVSSQTLTRFLLTLKSLDGLAILTRSPGGSYGISKPMWMSKPSGSEGDDIQVPLKVKSRPGMGLVNDLFKDPPPDIDPTILSSPRSAGTDLKNSSSPRTPRGNQHLLDPPTVSPGLS